ncbi:hypothetical protein HK096_008172, partial [Nowakowskiella sp. JEL0078]
MTQKNTSSSKQITTSLFSDKQPETPLPFSQLLVINAVTLLEPLQASILFPFIYQMVKSFNVTDDEKKLGYYVGFITAIFSMAQVISSIPIGWLSDKYGRRPLILIGLFGNTISSGLFGLSKTLTWALITRGALGLLNGNIGVTKSMLGELTDKTNQPKAFALLGFMMAIGGILGPGNFKSIAIGGLLSDPATQYPGSILDNSFFREYPYALPCLIASALNILAFIFGYFKLEETLGKNLQSGNNVKKQKSYGSIPESEVSSLGSESSLDSSSSDIVEDDDKIPFSAFVPVISLFLLAFHEIIFMEVLPLFASSPIKDGGLGLTSKKLGILLVVNGLFSLLSQILIFPRVAKFFGPLKTHRFGGLVFIFTDIIFPLTVVLVNQTFRFFGVTYQWSEIFLQIVMIPKAFGTICAFTSLFIVINNSVSPKFLGTVNGYGQTAATLARTVGPAIGGILFAFSLSH